MTPRARATAGVVWAVLVAPVAGGVRPAQADTPPSVWDVARDPAERDRWDLHVRVERLLHPADSDDVLAPEVRRGEELRLEAARTMLEEAGAERGPDVRLRFDLGIVYERLAVVEGRTDLHRRAVAVLEPAVDAAPDHPAATDALQALVDAYARLDRPRDELATWRRYIPRLSEDRERATPLMNMGEAEMRLGQLDDAIGTFHEVLRLCGDRPNSSSRNTLYALTLWDMAVALDRDGDPRGALESAAKATQMTWAQPGPLGQVRTVTGWDAIHDEQNVYFVPAWEREWYFALGYASAARGESDARAAADLWAHAEEHWGVYVAKASAAARQGEGRWLSIAQLRRDWARREHARAEAQAARARPRPASNANHGEQRL